MVLREGYSQGYRGVGALSTAVTPERNRAETTAPNAATTGHEVPLNLRVLFFKQLSLLGSTMGSFGELRTAWSAAVAGRVVPVVDRVLPVREVGRAHQLIEDRQVAGKVVLAVEGGW